MDNLTVLNNSSVKPLDGVRILDLTHAYSGPFCTMHLADQGAEVIKLEAPNKGDQSRSWAPFRNNSSAYYAYFNRNKLGLSLNLKSEKGKEIFKRLVAEVDVVVENFRVGTMEKLGLGYETLKEINPGLIYASISGFGLTGKHAGRPSYDIIAQAMSGMISMTGFPDGPVKAGPAIADNYSGTYLALAITMALYQKAKTGMGRRLDVSMLDTMFSVLEAGVIDYTVNGKIAEPVGNRDPGISPFDVFEAADGKFVIACGTQKFWLALCDVMDREDLKLDPRFLDNELRCTNNTLLSEIIASWAMQHTVEDLENKIISAGIPFGTILNVKQACELDVIRERNMLWTVHDNGIDEDIQIPGTPIKMQGCTDEPRCSAPLIGQHNEQILKNLLKMSDQEISTLKANHVI